MSADEMQLLAERLAVSSQRRPEDCLASLNALARSFRPEVPVGLDVIADRCARLTGVAPEAPR